MSILTPTNLDYLIPSLRLRLYDIDPATYRYAEEWLRRALVESVKTLQRWWNYKYLINDATYDVERNPNGVYLFPSPPIIEHGDEKAVILMASIIIKEGTLENNAWSAGSWKDAEISYSNIESMRSKSVSLDKDWEELTSMLKIPQKRLARAIKQSLPGYKKNLWEN